MRGLGREQAVGERNPTERTILAVGQNRLMEPPCLAAVYLSIQFFFFLQRNSSLLVGLWKAVGWPLGNGMPN